jgi:hypothetical protein
MEQQLTCETYEALKKGFFQGWKTWNVNSVLSHVHMPDGLSLNLGIKEYREGRYLREALIGQFPDETGLWPKEVLFPGDHAMDDSYTSIRVCWCDLEYRVESAQDEDAFYLLVTPVRTQKKPAMLVLETGFMWNRPGRVYVLGDAIRAESPEGTYLVRTSAPLFTEDPNIPVCSPYLAVRTDEPVG